MMSTKGWNGYSNLKRAWRAVCWVALAAPLQLHAGEAEAEACLFDDFADGEIFDCDPVCWLFPTPCCPGDIELNEDGVCMAGATPEVVTGMYTEESFDGDVSVVIVAPPLRSLVGVAIYYDPELTEMYWLFVGGQVALSRWDVSPAPPGVAPTPLGAMERAELPFDPGAEPFAFELRTVGERIDVFLWPASRSQEEGDLLFSVDDGMRRSGRVAVTGHDGCIHPSGFASLWDRLRRSVAVTATTTARLTSRMVCASSTGCFSEATRPVASP